MPDFVAALISAAVFCVGVIVLNALTHFAIWLHLAPSDLAENGLLQYAAALIAAYGTWRLTTRSGLAS